MNALALLPFAAAAALGSTHPVTFESFEYTGRDAVFSAPVAPGHYLNPVFAGFHPDPDVIRVGDDYYAVNSSFAYFPGIPVFHSRDLVNWTQVGNVVSRSGQLNYKGLGISRGIFAPALSHHDGIYYLICTFADAGGNFLMTAKDPAGPWSDPTWLAFDGIDPSLFFDDDGRAWIINNGVPPDNKPLYSGHRAIWLQEFDVASGKLVGPRGIIVNGGVHIADHPVWIEGPHLFRKDGWYYLLCAEGGTAEQHSEVIFRSRSLQGPYTPGPRNPILTQRNLPDDRPNPITCAGHADLVETPGGQWWAMFLGCRPYEGTTYNTGRETFLLPVTWTDGWPSILPAGIPVPLSPASNDGVSMVPAPAEPLTGNFTWRDEFKGPALAPSWLGIRGLPDLAFGSSASGRGLLLVPTPDTLWGDGRPAYVGRRVQHARFTASTTVDVPASHGISAGLVVLQNETHHYFFGIRQAENGLELFVERLNGGKPEQIARASEEETTRISLQIACDGASCDFRYSTNAGTWKTLLSGADATLLSTRVAGGFVGATVGLHARIDP